MLCSLTNTLQSKSSAQMRLELLAIRLGHIFPSIVCDMATSSEGLVLHVTHKLDINPTYVHKLMRSYVMHRLHDLELHMPGYIHVHILTESGSTMLHCLHELIVTRSDNHEETSS